MLYLTTTFSPMMMGEGRSAKVVEKTLEELKEIFQSEGIKPQDFVNAVSHENTAHLLTRILGFEVPFSRVNLTLHGRDQVLACIPKFRVGETREFTDEEIASANWRFFVISVK